MANKNEEKDVETQGKDAKDAKDAKVASGAAEGQAGPAAALARLGAPAWIGIAVVCAVLGILVGRFLLGGGSGSALGKTTLQESELDTTIATYVYNGKSHSLSARDVITSQSSLGSSKKDDGSYALPTADKVLAAARSQILEDEVESRNIEVSDEDRDAFATQYIGTTDYDSVASSYGMDADTVKKMVSQSAALAKLRSQVVTTDAGTQPTAPEKPESGKEDEATEAYAQYIIGLAGDEWDSSANAWKSSDGDYATALADYTVTNDSATYEAAQAAYYVAYQKYSTAASAAATQWTDFVNGLLSKATISISALNA